jgi:hypothetical protein
MKKSLAFLGKAVLFGAAGLLAACGSNVTNNPTGGPGGTGGTGGTGGAGGVGGAEAQQACADYCHKMETNNCGVPGDCTTFCAGLFDQAPAECVDELGAMFVCALPYASSCSNGAPPECASEEEAVEVCVEPSSECAGGECSNGVGMNGESSCGCAGTCQGKNYETDCATPSGGMTTCKCLVDGVEVGTCTNADADTCGVQTSCCNAQYFKLP